VDVAAIGAPTRCMTAAYAGCLPMFDWSERTGVRLRFIEPGKPVQNAFVESFNGKFRGIRPLSPH
jgi:transposase InsO family protein